MRRYQSECTEFSPEFKCIHERVLERERELHDTCRAALRDLGAAHVIEKMIHVLEQQDRTVIVGNERDEGRRRVVCRCTNNI